jgi:hypothetical protein
LQNREYNCDDDAESDVLPSCNQLSATRWVGAA